MIKLNCLTFKYNLASDRGGAYLVALITLTTSLILGLALLRLVSANTVQHRAIIDEGKAIHLADAGIAHGYWLYRHQNQPLPIGPITVELATGNAQVTVSKAPQESIRIEATGTSNNVSMSRFRVVRKNIRPFDMAFCINSTAVVKRDLQTGNSGKNGDIWINGDLIVDSKRSLSVDGDLHMHGLLYSQNTQISGECKSQTGRIAFPPIDLNYYATRADRVFSGSTDFLYGIVFLKSHELIFVNGNVKLRGIIFGRGTLVVAGKLDIEGDVIYASPALGKLAVLVAGDMKTKAAVDLLHGLYYAHKADNSAEFRSDSSIKVEYGSIIADTFHDGSREIEIIADPAFKDTDLPHRLRLPGYEPAS